jgi:hypothetical protein
MKHPLAVSLTLRLSHVVIRCITKFLTPTLAISGQQDKINLEHLIPREFDSWKLDPSTAALMVNPDTQGLLNKIYNQTLSRT